MKPETRIYKVDCKNVPKMFIYVSHREFKEINKWTCKGSSKKQHTKHMLFSVIRLIIISS